ncbi:MAG: hypothetical protein M0C28_42195 [Candidatus Moduliflexus flocculans]|nr:hypothetical protein [Candidatus Moduliflexus flocculans]
MAGNPVDAEDISQEVFLKVYRSFSTFRKGAKLGSWLYRVTYNASIDHLRRKRRGARAGRGRGPGAACRRRRGLLPGPVPSDPAAAAESGQLRERIARALEARSRRRNGRSSSSAITKISCSRTSPSRSACPSARSRAISSGPSASSRRSCAGPALVSGTRRPPMSECRKCHDRHDRSLLRRARTRPTGSALERHLAACPDCAAASSPRLRSDPRADGRAPAVPSPGRSSGTATGTGSPAGCSGSRSRRAGGPSLVRPSAPALSAVSACPAGRFQAAGAAALLLDRRPHRQLGSSVPSRRTVRERRPRDRRPCRRPGRRRPSSRPRTSSSAPRSCSSASSTTGPASRTPTPWTSTASGPCRATWPPRPRRLRRSLSARDQKRLRALVGELEVIMMQIANLGSGQDAEGIELVKQGVDARGIFLKIDLDRLGRDARTAAPAPAGTGARSANRSQRPKEKRP